METLLKLYRLLTGRPTVADVVGIFERVSKSLDAIAVREYAREQSLTEEARKLYSDADDAAAEAVRAEGVAQKVRGLIG